MGSNAYKNAINQYAEKGYTEKIEEAGDPKG